MRCWHTETIGFGVGIAAAILCFVSPAFASPQPPLNCAASPFGPPDADGWITIPYTLSSRRFQYDRAEIPAQKYYANNTDYRWQTWFSGNVTHVLRPRLGIDSSRRLLLRFSGVKTQAGVPMQAWPGDRSGAVTIAPGAVEVSLDTAQLPPVAGGWLWVPAW